MVSGKSRLLNKDILFSALLLTIILVAGVKVLKLSSPPAIELLQIELDTNKLAEGDLVFRKGRDLLSRLVLTQGESAQFSHVGIIVRHKGMISVIHSLPESASSVSGVQIEPLSSFISIENASDIAVYRLIKNDPKLIQKIRAYVLLQVGKPFDADFLLSSDNNIYCTELAVKAFAAAGVELIANQAPIRVMLIDEPVIPPDYLRRSRLLKQI